jgi:hypothetical protein
MNPDPAISAAAAVNAVNVAAPNNTPQGNGGGDRSPFSSLKDLYA